MMVKIICLGLGFIMGAVAVMVYACCKISSDIARKEEKWSDDE